MTAKYDPEHYLESTLRTLKDYAVANFNTQIYEVVMEFPGADMDAGKLPNKKTVIHFELDDDASEAVGFGSNAFENNYDPALQQITPQYATMHTLSFDVGIWASDASGGTTFRMRAKQTLEFMFGMNSGGIERLREFSDNGDGVLEIVGFTGGRFIPDTAENDVRLYRMVDCTLMIRVYSRTPIAIQQPIPTVEDHSQVPNVTIIG